MEPLWNHASAGRYSLAATSDVVVVGGGITGLTTALLLARAGREVSVFEARHIGAGTTGRSSAKVSLLQGTKLSRLMKRHERAHVESYVAANRSAQDWLVSFALEHGVPVLQRPACTFARFASERQMVEDEHAAATSLGLPVRWDEAPLIPGTIHGATVLDDQLALDPSALVAALAAAFRDAGGTVVESARVIEVSRSDDSRLDLDSGETLGFNEMVLATGSPILDRGLFFAKLVTQRSYVVALEVDSPPGIMALSAGSPVVSLRDAIAPSGKPAVLVGGHGHATGRVRHEADHLAALRSWAASAFPDGTEVAAWSAQDHRTWDEYPWVGPIPRGGGHIHAATGFDKWGLTNGVAAAQLLARVLASDAQPGYWGRAPRRASDLAAVASANLAVAREGLAGWLSAPARRRRFCTHLGGPLDWNDAENTWDCPLHGSRFSADGCVLEGPAMRPLR